MSLALIQSYSSAEEEDDENEAQNDLLHSSSDDERRDAVSDYASKPLFDLPKPSSHGAASSLLPSAFDAFAEVSGPPGFLNSCVEEPSLAAGEEGGSRWRHGRRRNRKERKDLPAVGELVGTRPKGMAKSTLLVLNHRLIIRMCMGVTPRGGSLPREMVDLFRGRLIAHTSVNLRRGYVLVKILDLPLDEESNMAEGAVMESKPQLVGIHERVRSDIEGKTTPPPAVQPNGSLSTAQGVKRIATATNPNAEDAAELLRMCLQCGIPKTFSNARGMVCPVCGDRPPADPNNEAAKKKGSLIKDKEKNKRMKGQSSHATWKSETEMQLRQQFD